MDLHKSYAAEAEAAIALAPPWHSYENLIKEYPQEKDQHELWYKSIMEEMRKGVVLTFPDEPGKMEIDEGRYIRAATIFDGLSKIMQKEAGPSRANEARIYLTDKVSKWAEWVNWELNSRRGAVSPPPIPWKT